jgi:hypothetical protein
VVLGFELKALHLLGKVFYHLSHSTSPEEKALDGKNDLL